MEEKLKTFICEIRTEAMLEFEGICEKVALAKCNPQEFYIVQCILDEAQKLFESKQGA